MTSNDKGVPAILPAAPVIRPPTRTLLRDAGSHALRNAMDSTTGVLMLIVMFCIGVVTWAGGVPIAGVAILAVALLGFTAFHLIAGWDHAVNGPVREAREQARLHAERVKTARSSASSAFNELMGDNAEDWHRLHEPLKRLLEDEAARDVADDVSLRLHSLSEAFDKAISDAGRSDTGPIKAEAMAASRSLVEAAITRHEEIDRRIRASDSVRAPDVTRRFAETARAVAGLASVPTALPPPSASAALQRLIGIAEDALATDPDLVDSNGARVDALVREHLPRLLERHAEAARSPSSDLTRVDAKLEEGVDEVRASIEEALAADAEARFDSLVTEVGFLRMRRGE